VREIREWGGRDERMESERDERERDEREREGGRDRNVRG
jgi:hypothetical protein